MVSLPLIYFHVQKAPTCFYQGELDKPLPDNGAYESVFLKYLSTNIEAVKSPPTQY